MKWKKLVICVGTLAFSAAGLPAADLILNEYNAVRASRWLDCDGMNCCCLEPVCDGGDGPGTVCADDGECLGHYECSPDDGLTFTGDMCDPANGDADCTGLDPSWTCEAHTTDGACLCDPPCKQDVFFGRVQGNGGNWIELVVTPNNVDIRGWKLEWTEDPSDVGTLTLTDDPLWADLRAGTIITFTELDTAAGGLDTDTSYDPNGGDWWININTLSSDGTPQTQYVTTVTNVLGDGPGAFSVGNDNWQVTILDADSNTVFGPCGEGIRFVCDGGSNDDQPCAGDGDCDGGLCEAIGVNSREVFKLQEDPSADIDPATSNYKDGTSSTFGHPNIWSGGDKSQDFTCIRCDDGVFCNGTEGCDVKGVCQLGVEPCLDNVHCDEAAVRCLECIDDAECEDDNPCTEDLCDGGACQFSEIPGCGGGNGTPADADADGVVDALDECPNTPDQESVDERGCSCSQIDADDDGVDDCTDECTETPADEAADERGCSCSQLDDDDDGVDSCTDECTETPDDEAADARGCSCSQLDDDDDGVDDCIDECPDTRAEEAADERGCGCSQLDDDDDGVNYCSDQCPETLSGETVDADGCSCLQLDPDGDDDEDGVLNCADHCEDTPLGNAVDPQGCSCLQNDPDPDNDGDGVPNCLDRCTSTSTGATVDDAGCEVESPDDTLAPAEVPDEEDADGDADSSERPAEGEAEDAATSQSRWGLCGLIGLTEFACLLAGLLMLRFAQHTHGYPGASAAYVALQDIHRPRTS